MNKKFFGVFSLLLALLTGCKQNPMYNQDPATYYELHDLEAAIAIRNSDEKKLTELLEQKKVNPNTAGKKDFKLLAWAMGFNNLKIVELLLQHGASPDITVKVDGYDMRLINIAVGAKKPDLLALLLKYKANPNAIEGHKTPLFEASLYDFGTERIEMLIKAGADIEYADSAGKTAILVAALSNNYECVDKLLDYGANPNVVMKNGTNLEKIIKKFPLDQKSEFWKWQRKVMDRVGIK
jgi:ankyrin repeat protein